MKANEVNEIINNICEKIGIGISNAKEFVPIFAKYKAIDSALKWIGFLAIPIKIPNARKRRVIETVVNAFIRYIRSIEGLTNGTSIKILHPRQVSGVK